ncbi:hypothetical protein SRABI96_03460 [Peribacillus sp. Bi96]|nr:hypothetical protein SRABI96_03460 [Peribacillus sp. Bi96]
MLNTAAEWVLSTPKTFTSFSICVLCNDEDTMGTYIVQNDQRQHCEKVRKGIAPFINSTR